MGVGLLALALASCSAKQEPPVAAPPVAPAAPVAPSATPTPAATPAPEVAAAPVPVATPETKKHRSHAFHVPLLSLVLAQVSEVSLSDSQKPTTDAIEADLDKQGAAMLEPHGKLSADLADMASAGKLDKARLDSDTKAVVSAAIATTASAEDALNKLHKALDPGQRKKVVELLNAAMQEHSEHPRGDHEEGGHHGEPPKDGKSGHEKSGKSGHFEAAKEGGAKDMRGAPAGHPGHDDGGGCPFDHHGTEQGGPEKLTGELGLSPEQTEKLKKKLSSDMKAGEASAKEHKSTMQKHMKAFGEAFVTDKFDAKSLQLGKHVGDMAKKMVAKKVQFVEAVLSVVTPEQRAKFGEHIRAYSKPSDK